MLSSLKNWLTLEYAIIAIALVLIVHVIMDYFRFRTFKSHAKDAEKDRGKK